MTEPIQNRTRNRFQNHDGTRSGTTDQTQTQIQTVVSAVCGCGNSNSSIVKVCTTRGRDDKRMAAVAASSRGVR